MSRTVTDLADYTLGEILTLVGGQFAVGVFLANGEFFHALALWMAYVAVVALIRIRLAIARR